MIAARYGHDTAVHLLLTLLPPTSSPYAVDPNAQDARGDTALHYASSYGQLKVARTLITHGADPWIRNHFSWTPVDYSSTVQAEMYLRDLVADLKRRADEAQQQQQQQQLVAGGSGNGSGSGNGAGEGLLGRGGVRLVPASESAGGGGGASGGGRGRGYVGGEMTDNERTSPNRRVQGGGGGGVVGGEVHQVVAVVVVVAVGLVTTVQVD